MTDRAVYYVASCSLIAVLIVCSCVITLHGIDSGFWSFKTPEEKIVQQKLADASCKR